MNSICGASMMWMGKPSDVEERRAGGYVAEGAG